MIYFNCGFDTSRKLLLLFCIFYCVRFFMDYNFVHDFAYIVQSCIKFGAGKLMFTQFDFNA